MPCSKRFFTLHLSFSERLRTSSCAKEASSVSMTSPSAERESGDLVEACFRKLETMRTVLLRVIPNIIGLTLEETIKKLSDDVFNVKSKPTYIPEEDDKKVIEIAFLDENDYDITVIYNNLSSASAESAEGGFITVIEGMNSMTDIYHMWENHNLAAKYKNIDVYIKMKLDTEKKEGRLNNIQQVKDAIIQLLKKEMNK